MGACDISFELDKKASITEIKDAFQRQVSEDSSTNGHRSGYSGDFQTVRGVDFGHLGQVFPTYDDAFEYCMKHAKKWENAIAVYYASVDIKKNAKLTKLSKQTKVTRELLQTWRDVKLDKSNAFKTCTNCKSRLATKHIPWNECPLCKTDLRAKRVVNRIAKLQTKLTALETQYNALIKQLQLEAVKKAKTKDIKTLVAGLGAC